MIFLSFEAQRSLDGQPIDGTVGHAGIVVTRDHKIFYDKIIPARPRIRGMASRSPRFAGRGSLDSAQPRHNRQIRENRTDDLHSRNVEAMV